MDHNNYDYISFITAFDDDTKRNDEILEGLLRIYLNKKKIPNELNRFLRNKY
jgi:hypothetical protein